MNPRRTPHVRLVRLKPTDSDALARDLMTLADLARTGAITGLAYTALLPRGGSAEGLLGRARLDLPRAYLGAGRLAETIMAMADEADSAGHDEADSADDEGRA